MKARSEVGFSERAREDRLDAKAGAGLRRARLVALFVGATIVLNFPLLSVFSRDRLLFGMPVLAVGVFGLWIGVVALLALLLRGAK